MKRSKPLRRSGPIRRKPPRRLERDAGEAGYTHWLHEVPGCGGVYGSPLHQCSGPIEAAHFRNVTGVGRKEPASYQIALCRKTHRDYDQNKGRFANTERETRKLWFLAILAIQRTRWLALTDAERAEWGRRARERGRDAA